MIRSNVSSVALVAALASGCGGMTASPLVGDAADPKGSSSTSSSSAVEDDTVEEACAAEASAICALRDSCTDGFSNQITYGSVALCVSQRTASCVAGMSSPDNANGIEAIQACAEAYPSEACSDWWDGNTIAACRSPLGARSIGVACGVNSQCASGICGISINAECGTCQAPPVPGAPCESSSNCGYDLSCPLVAPATSGVCTIREAKGGACDGYHLCQGGLACIGSDTAELIMGTCQTGQTTVGAACDKETGPGCDGELYLFCSSGTCQREAVVSAGMLCGSFGSLADIQCESGAMCVKPGGSPAGTCVAAAANGGACDSVAGPPCLSPAKCVMGDGGTSGTCVFPDPVSCG